MWLASCLAAGLGVAVGGSLRVAGHSLESLRCLSKAGGPDGLWNMEYLSGHTQTVVGRLSASLARVPKQCCPQSLTWDE